MKVSPSGLRFGFFLRWVFPFLLVTGLGYLFGFVHGASSLANQVQDKFVCIAK